MNLAQYRLVPSPPWCVRERFHDGRSTSRCRRGFMYSVLLLLLLVLLLLLLLLPLNNLTILLPAGRV